ncbi:MAG: peptidoglycan recognition protein family protein [Fimbriimonadaceae bacterium]|nr:peptidoglycan recognition protein family protein [Fimbriimonadaceae bacterium]
MTVHHTAVVLGDNRNSPSRLRQHQRYHMDVKGWIDIAYHVGVDRDGNIFELRSTKLAGDTATDYDTTGHFLVVCEGDFDQEPLSDAQFEGAAIAFAWAAQNFNVLPDTLASHREVTPTTSCPGANLEAKVASGDLRNRVSEILGLGPVSLPLICGAEAAETVARIEAGR